MAGEVRGRLVKLGPASWLELVSWLELGLVVELWSVLNSVVVSTKLFHTTRVMVSAKA